MSKTSVKIKVQHDSNIHQGVCVQNFPKQHGYHQLQPKVLVQIITKINMYSMESFKFIYHTSAQSCPKLQVMFKGSKKEVKGAEAIYDYLTELNAKIRQV